MKLIPTKLLSPVASICTVAFCLSSSLLLHSQSTNAQPIIRQSGSSQLVAITIPNFRPSATYSNNTLEISIPQAVIAGPIEQILRANEGRIKETEFQRIDIRNMRFSWVREPFDPCGNKPNCITSSKRRTENVSGLRVAGEWQFQFRERLVRNPFTGKWTHTPWNSVSGSFSQPLYFQVNDSRLALQPGGLTLKGERIYKEAVAPIAGIFGVQGQIKENLRNAIQDINGMDLRQMLIEYGSQQSANQLGVNQEAVNQLISQNLGTIGARVSEGNLDLVVSVALPQSVLNLAENNVANLSQKLPPGTDLGHGDLPRAFVDVNGDGRTDYCRFVGDLPNLFIACALGSSDGFGEQYAYQSIKGIDKGYNDRPRGFRDANSDGRADYCRFVGDPPNIYESCNLATPSGFDPNQYTLKLP
jgi:hypothetical protein